MVTVTRSEKKEHTRGRLLAAAAKVFAAKGYYGAAVDDVAAEAGLTKGAVYAHFRTKEALYLALTIEQGKRQLEEARESFGRASTPAERLDWAAERFAAAVADRRRMALELEFFTYAARDPKLRQEMRELQAKAAEVNAAFCRRLWKERGIKPSITPEDFHLILNGLAVELGKKALLDPRLDISAEAKRLFRLVIDTIR